MFLVHSTRVNTASVLQECVEGSFIMRCSARDVVATNKYGQPIIIFILQQVRNKGFS